MEKHGFRDYLDVAGDVAMALRNGTAVVALESTIISHGMPYPQNVDTAMRLESTVREHGAVPATIAILGGRLKVGLSHDEIGRLGEHGPQAHKTSRRDMPYVVSRGADGATTVAATMIIAAMAGIRVFATGGIGGVHRGAETSMDISADLDELGRTSVAVVCAGVKSVLDVGLTLEYLETKGVPVVGFGTDTLPAFYTRSSGFPVDHRVDTPAEAARLMQIKWELGLAGGIVIANPVPEEFALQDEEIDGVIEDAIAAMNRDGIVGKQATPYLLARIAERSGGRSLQTNIALAVHNAGLAAAIAVEYAKL